MAHPPFRQAGKSPWPPVIVVLIVSLAAFLIWNNFVLQRHGPIAPELESPAQDARVTELTTLVWRHEEADTTRLSNLQFLICVMDMAAGEGCGWPSPLAPQPFRRWTAAASAVPSASIPNTKIHEYTFAVPAADAIERMSAGRTLHWTVAACWEPAQKDCTAASEKSFVQVGANIKGEPPAGDYFSSTGILRVSWRASGDADVDTGAFDFEYWYIPIATNDYGQPILDLTDPAIPPSPLFVTRECDVITATSAVDISTVHGILVDEPVVFPRATHPGIPANSPSRIPLVAEDIEIEAPGGVVCCLRVDPDNVRLEPNENDNFGSGIEAVATG